MSKLSRRTILTAAAGAAALGGGASMQTASAAPAPATAKVLKVQYTTGSHTVPITAYEMWDDPLFSDFDTWIRPFPHPFDTINDPGGPDVIVLCSYLVAGYPEADRVHIQRYLDSGKGLVILHHAVGENQAWPYWKEQVVGGALIQVYLPGMPRSGLKQFPKQKLTPVLDHPITRGVQPFSVPPDELFYNMWFDPKTMPRMLLRSDDPDLANNNGMNAWLGVHPKARVVCWQTGHTDQVNADPRYRSMVHRMVLWAGGKLV